MEIPIENKNDQDEEFNWGSTIDESKKNEDNKDNKDNKEDDEEWGKNIGNYNQLLINLKD